MSTDVSNRAQVIELAKAILANATDGNYDPQDVAEKAHSLRSLAGEDAGWHQRFGIPGIPKSEVLFPEAHGD